MSAADPLALPNSNKYDNYPFLDSGITSQFFWVLFKDKVLRIDRFHTNKKTTK